MADSDGELGEETGGALRKRLETAEAEKRTLAKELAGLKAEREIADKAYKYVTAADLADVPLAELSTKAAEIEESKRKQRADVLREVLVGQGVPESELDAAVEQHFAPKQDQQQKSAATIASLTSLTGSPVGQMPSRAEGRDLILEAVTESARKR